MSLSAVSNAGPFIHLHQIGFLELLAIFDCLVTSEQVVKEVTMPGRVPENCINTLANLVIHPVTLMDIFDLRGQLVGFDLQEGELSGLYLCRQLNITLFLTDDLEARRAAKFLGMEPHGSVGIIALAYHEGKLTMPQTKEALYALLNKSTLFLTPAIVEQAIQLLEQST
ncbi:hypothetical protein HRbin17_01327 [bacterium HR17]|uniref:DUF3368 domain-containing protein n=1 Tax=Candidatus Fervidibacter japonicus TaxID=2035412 RepID=A0A2H5XCA0_9BACT|nr:hypothetical protein HRbin17_01327 [bacterium HR17]